MAARSEWGIKVFAAGADPAPEHATAAQAMHGELGRLSVSARLIPTPPDGGPGIRPPLLLNACYLVGDELAGQFAAAITDLAATHPSVRLAVSGPSPAAAW